MNAQTFLDNFGYIANAPNGVERLRELVFYFAITGGLSSQEDGDSDVAAIREETLRARRSYFEENNVRRAQRKNAELRQTVADVPPWWTLIPAGDLVHLINGRAFKPSDWQSTGLPIIRIQNLNNPNAPFNYYEGELMEGHKVSTGDMLLSWSGTPGTSFGAFIWNRGEAALNQHIFKVIIYCGGIDKQYLKMAINACLEALIGSARGGVGLKHVTKGQIEALQIPLPPLEEQKRIVAKVDELMALCDKLEALRQKRENLCKNTRAAALLALETASDSFGLETAWNRVGEHLLYLIDGEAAANEIATAIKEIAIRGLISNKNSEHQEDLLEELSKKKRGKRIAKLRTSTINSVLPSNWKWVLLEDLLKGSDSGWSPKCDTIPRTGDLWGVLKVSAVTWGDYRPEENKQLPSTLEPRPEYEVAPGDFLLSRANTADLVARSVIAPAESPRHLLMSDEIVRLQFLDDRLKPWINLVNNSQMAREYYKKNATGTSNSMKNVSRKVIHELPIPLPPLATQSEIIARIQKLTGYCDTLAAQLTTLSKISQHLTSAIISSITGTQIKEQEKMKAPKMELVSKLKIGTTPKPKDQAPLTSLLTKNEGELSAKTLWTHSGLEIAEFYQQLKTEMANGWIVEPEKAVMREVTAD